MLSGHSNTVITRHSNGRKQIIKRLLKPAANFHCPLANVYSNSFFFVPERCDIPLGSEDGRLPDVAFTASSIYNAHYAAYQGRLNAMRSGSRFGSWIARYNNRRQWFQIDLGNKAIVIKCGIQGRYDANQWVKSYTIAYGMNGFHFRFYREGGRTRVCFDSL